MYSDLIIGVNDLNKGDIMTLSERTIVATVLKEIAEALNEGAAGPTEYWFKKLAERLSVRAIKILKDYC